MLNLLEQNVKMNVKRLRILRCLMDERCKENYGISAAGYYYRVRKVKEAYLDQVSEEKLQENLAIVPKELFHEDQSVQ